MGVLFLLLSSLALNFMTVCCFDENGYVTYCPCMGRFGNQADHFLGVLAFSKGINRTLILPPWVEYRYGEPKSIQVPFDTYFKVSSLTQFHRVITMENFMSDIAPKLWPEHKRISFCYMQRSGEEENSCNAKSGNPFGPFWDSFHIEFVGSQFYGPLNYDAHNFEMMGKWKEKYDGEEWPVLAFTGLALYRVFYIEEHCVGISIFSNETLSRFNPSGAPASFPVQNGNQWLQKYLSWSDEYSNKAQVFIKNNMSGGGFLGIHLRNGQDWVKACQHVHDSPTLFAAPQCVGYKNERGPLTISMCLPQKNEVTKQVKRALKKGNDIKYVFVASDSNHMIEELTSALQTTEVKVLRLHPSNPHLDLAILGQANYFIGNCVSSFSAFVKRERDMRGLPSEFWSFPQRKKQRHEDL